jgi:hypothetical protein
MAILGIMRLVNSEALARYRKAASRGNPTEFTQAPVIFRGTVSWMNYILHNQLLWCLLE